MSARKQPRAPRTLVCHDIRSESSEIYMTAGDPVDEVVEDEVLASLCDHFNP
jgi:hypothetical protein